LLSVLQLSLRPMQLELGLVGVEQQRLQSVGVEVEEPQLPQRCWA
jgi:hypothetical protein